MAGETPLPSPPRPSSVSIAEPLSQPPRLTTETHNNQRELTSIKTFRPLFSPSRLLLLLPLRVPSSLSPPPDSGVESYYNSQCVEDVKVVALGYILGIGDGGGLGDFAEEDDGDDDYGGDDGEHEEEAQWAVGEESGAEVRENGAGETNIVFEDP
ncbi:hypothetical protein Scep_008063 [Stephania cephalantha]|uniref:Uncharacterized protein n=1 Tax=Stephania cephalantha TaxID=152367 RepID=A0AAP0PQM0_9MAGN